MKKLLLCVFVLLLGFGLSACDGNVDALEVDSYEFAGAVSRDAQFNYASQEIMVDDDESANGNDDPVGGWGRRGDGILYRFYEDGTAINLRDQEEFTWNADGSLSADRYESWSLNDGMLTITWTGGASFEYTRVGTRYPDNGGSEVDDPDPVVDNEGESEIDDHDSVVDNEDESAAGYHGLFGEWERRQERERRRGRGRRWDGIWYRFYPDGTAINLKTHEEFTWNADGSLNANRYESWSINNGTLTIAWTCGISFNFTRVNN